MLSATALAAIRGYQRYLSPIKGYSCAYRLVHGGTGCSGFAKAEIAEHGLILALPAIRRRLKDCQAAARKLPRPKKPVRGRRWYDDVNATNCDVSACDCTGCHMPDLHHCSACDIGDLSSCDCNPDCCHL